MKTDRIFIGTIKKSTYLEDKIKFNNCDIEDEFSSVDCVIYEEYGSKTYKKKAYLYKIDDDKYIDIEKLSNVLDYILINKKIKSNSTLILNTKPNDENVLYVDKTTLVPYKSRSNNISLHHLKKTLKTK